MTQIKHALAFVFGVLYTSCWWLGTTDFTPYTIIARLGIIFGGLFIIGTFIFFMVNYWNEE